jgi:hypothetical protein
MRFMSTLCAVVLMTPVAGMAQTSQPDVIQVDSGSRVRVAAPVFGRRKQVGTVVSLTRDTLLLREGADPIFQPVATSEITALDVASGTHTRKGKGALLGFVLGAGIAGGISAMSWQKTSDFDFGRAGDAAFYAVPGGLIGAVVGMLAGAQQTETWVPVNLPRRN